MIEPMNIHVAHDIIARTYTYSCATCGEAFLTLTEEQIAAANHIMDLYPTDPHACKTKEPTT
jgi:hypothetical protein